jgi:hypothetical protein
MLSLLFVLTLVASAGFLQAQAGGMGMPELGNLSSSAILGWYAWHTASKTIPNLVRHFREELATCRAQHQAQFDAFRQELAFERTQRHADQAALTEALAELCDRLSS